MNSQPFALHLNPQARLADFFWGFGPRRDIAALRQCPGSGEDLSAK